MSKRTYTDPRSTDFYALLHAAAAGGDVSHDIGKLPLPPGRDRIGFSAEVRSTVAKLHRLHREGCKEDARDEADHAIELHLGAWGDSGPPKQAEADRAAAVDAAFAAGPDAMAALIPRNIF